MRNLPQGPYNFKDTEDKILKFWNSKPFFKPEYVKNAPTFTMVLPPPNANGSLHLGHMSGYTYQDLMGRYNRMMGKKVLLLPGKDHAGIQTEVVFEKILENKGINKLSLGREKFYEQCFEFCKEMSKTARSQEQRLGLSADFDREVFTLDPKIVQIVLETFIKLNNDGYVYKGAKIVNWCIRCQTTLADIDTEHKAREGTLTYIKYPLKNDSNFLVIATTRPETMLGDTALVVNPSDPRYVHLIGKTVIVPIVNREIPIIASRRIDKEFGTGVLKLTPAHSNDDAIIAQEYETENGKKIPSINVIWKDGRMVGPIPQKYKGMKVNAARVEIIKELLELGNIEKSETIQQNVVVCERCKSVIEPLMSSQWFIKVEDLKQPAIDCVLSGEVTIHPNTRSKMYIEWLKNLRDWPVSRQLWWGYRLPVWYKGKKEEYVNDDGEVYEKIGDIKVNEINSKELIRVSIDKPDDEWIQDEDIFDTWFSSGQLPFSTLMVHDLFDEYYPTQVLDTAYDIIFLWVSRMIMLGLYRTGKVPFQNVYLNGLVTDKNGQKMSKSKGNGIDPYELIEKYGTDSIRYSFVMGISPAQSNALYEEKIKGFRNFNNKIWNASKFVITNLELYSQTPQFETLGNIKDVNDLLNIFPKDKFTKEDIEMINNFSDIESKYSKYFESFKYGIITSKLYESFWHEFCDKYIENAKQRLEDDNAAIPKSILYYCLKKYIWMLHPFIPFITEEIWQHLVNDCSYESSIMYSKL